MNDEQCVFCRIVKGELPSRKVYEDDHVLAFHDIHPVAPVHFMIIPKDHVTSLARLEERHRAVMGQMMMLAAPLAAQQGSTDGFRTIINTGRVGRQDVMHLHMHVHVHEHMGIEQNSPTPEELRCGFQAEWLSMLGAMPDAAGTIPDNSG